MLYLLRYKSKIASSFVYGLSLQKKMVYVKSEKLIEFVYGDDVITSLIEFGK